jgi:hypothetical protein
MQPASVITVLSTARLRSGHAARGLLVMWSSLTLLAVLAATPVIASLERHFGHSFSATQLVRELDPAAIIEWNRTAAGDPFSAAAATIAVALLAALTLSVFWAGGAMGQLSRRTPFFEGGRRYFWRFLRLALFAGLFYAALLAAYSAANRGIGEVFCESMEEWPIVVWRNALTAAALLAAALLAAAFDYAKVRLVVNDRRGAIHAGFEGLGLVLRHPWRALAPLAFIALCGILIFAFYQTSYNVFDYRGLRTILISIAGQQLYMFLRLWLRLWHWSACLQVDASLRAPAPAWAISTPEPHGDNI